MSNAAKAAIAVSRIWPVPSFLVACLIVSLSSPLSMDFWICFSLSVAATLVSTITGLALFLPWLLKAGIDFLVSIYLSNVLILVSYLVINDYLIGLFYRFH